LWKVFDSFLDVAVGQLVVGVGSLLLFLFLRVLSLLFSAGPTAAQLQMGN
jgi:hypothetical protein